MTTFQYSSDLHLEFNENENNFEDIIKPTADNLILAGDIGYPSQKIYEKFIEYCSKHFKKVIVISGNHEYYGRIMEETEKEIREITKKFSNVFYLQNECLELPNNILVIGATLWTDVPANKKADIKLGMSDYYKIYKNPKELITVEDTCEHHKTSVNYITNTIAKNLDKKIIVVTHHLPSIKMIDKKFICNSYNSAFYTYLHHLITKPVVAWISGHTHVSTTTFINNVFCGVNPKGYPKETSGYSNTASFII
jgi:predicted phosphodiesterase